MSQLVLCLLGPPRLELDGELIQLGRRRAVALLAYLAVTGLGSGGGDHRRDTLTTLLWPEYDPRRARADLRRTLSVLNRALGEQWLTVDRETVSLNPDADLWLDVNAFHQWLAACETHGHPLTKVCADCLPSLTEAVTLYRDDFMTGFTLRDSLAFDEWQFFQAEGLRSELAGVLERLVRWHNSQGEYEPAISYARRWLGLDPLQETAHQRLMGLYAQSDQRTAALRQYRTCIRILEQELGIPHSGETTALYERIRAARLRREETSKSGAERDVLTPPAPRLPAPLPHTPSFISQDKETAEVEKRIFVAREGELAQMSRYLEAALAGQGHMVFVTGEAGSGKTALAHEFARRAQEAWADLVVASGSCNAHTGPGDPYSPFREMLGLLSGDVEAGWTRGTITRENARRLWTLLPISFQALVEFGPDLVDALIPGAALIARAATLLPEQTDWSDRLQQISERGAAGDGASSVAQSDLFEQVASVLQALARGRPLLLVMDDAQWADVASINLLFHLGQRLAGSRILMVVAYRPDDVALGRPLTLPTVAGQRERHPLESVVNELKRIFGEVQVDLDRAMGRRFVETFLDAEPNQLGPGFRAALYQRTQGHPLFTVELLHDMQERGDILQDDAGRWVEGATLNWGRLPARVEAVIEERVGRLDERLRDVLTVASVEGERFTAQVVARVQAIRERQVLRALSQELETRHRLVREQDEVQIDGRFLSRYQFVHALFQGYLYNALGAGERRLLHSEVALVLEEFYKDRTAEIAVQLAHHYAEAGQGEKAIDYLLHAGDQARVAYAHAEAIDYYRRALAFLKKAGARSVAPEREYERAARTLMKLGLTYHTAFDFRRARQAYEEGFALWQQAGATQPSVPPPPAPHALRMSRTNPPTMDPTLAGDSSSTGVIDQLFSGLAEQTSEMEVVPDVAQSWDVSEGGRKYVFYLRDDVRWSDGAPVTAGDFEYAWKRALDPATGSPIASLLYDVRGARAFHQGKGARDEVGVRALDEVTLVAELEEPTAYFPYLLALRATFPVPRHVVEAHGEAWTEMGKIVTNGPFRLETWQPGGAGVLSRNPAYHGRFRGNLQQVELFLREDPSVILEVYEADGLDIIWSLWNLPISEWNRTLQQHAEEYVSLPEMSTHYVRFNVNWPPFDDPRVRRAFVLATDRETLADVVTRGYVFPATGGFVPPGLPGHSAGIGLSYDPEKARQLLADAGYPDGLGFPVAHALAAQGREPWCEYLRAQWQENLGVDIPWETVEWTTFFDQLGSASPPIAIDGWVADYPDPDNFLRVWLQQQQIDWRNETYARLVEKARRVMDQGERMELYGQADRILVKEAVIMPLVYRRWHMMVKPWVSKIPTWVIKWKDVIIEPH